MLYFVDTIYLDEGNNFQIDRSGTNFSEMQKVVQKQSNEIDCRRKFMLLVRNNGQYIRRQEWLLLLNTAVLEFVTENQGWGARPYADLNLLKF